MSFDDPNKLRTGYWITGEGVVHTCTWKQDHDYILYLYHDSYKSAMEAGWIRITFLEGFAIDLPPFLTPKVTSVFMNLVKEHSFEYACDPYVKLYNETFGKEMNRMELAKTTSNLQIAF